MREIRLRTLGYYFPCVHFHVPKYQWQANDSGYYAIKRRLASFLFSPFPPLPHKDLNLRFHFARRKESKHLYKNNQNNDSQTLQGFKTISLF